MAQRLDQNFCNLAVNSSAIDLIKAWDTGGIEVMSSCQVPSEGNDNNSQLKPENSNLKKLPQQEFEDPDLIKSAKLISDCVQLPGRYGGDGSVGTVVLAGQPTEIAAWLRENQIVTDEEELGKLLQHKPCRPNATQEGDQHDDSVMTSGIYCVLPRQGNTLSHCSTSLG